MVETNRWQSDTQQDSKNIKLSARNSHDKSEASLHGMAGTSIGQMVDSGIDKGMEKTEDAAISVGEKLSNFGETIDQSLPESGVFRATVGKLADGLKISGEYLQTHNVSDMSNDVTDTIRNHPFPAVLTGIGLGFLLGQLLLRK
jgi:ElaB/YqjD/DUF883 family membrane-anchored ribosome-binding protein